MNITSVPSADVGELPSALLKYFPRPNLQILTCFCFLRVTSRPVPVVTKAFRGKINKQPLGYFLPG